MLCISNLVPSTGMVRAQETRIDAVCEIEEEEKEEVLYSKILYLQSKSRNQRSK